MDHSSGDNVIYVQSNSTSYLAYYTFAISTVGMLLTCVAITVLLLTACLFELWRKSHKNQLLVNFALARFFYALIRYVYNLGDAFGLYSVDYHLIDFSVLFILYTELTLVIWMFLFSKHMYDSLVKVFTTRDSGVLFKKCIYAWVVPAPVSFILNLLFYSQREEDLFVYLIYIFVIKWPVMISTGVFLILVLTSILKNSRGSNFRIVIIMLLMICMFCVQLLLHDLYLIIYKVVSYDTDLMYSVFVMFNVTTMFHCPISVFFWLFGNADTRKMWSTKVGQKPRVTSYLSNRC